MVNRLDQNQLIQLIEQLDKSSLAYLNYETQDVKVVLSKEMPTQATVEPHKAKEVQTVEVQSALAPVEQVDISRVDVEVVPSSSELEGQFITSPMVGVVYLQPSPDKDPFIKVGDVISEGDTVVIVEAMKLMNEIQSNLSGTVAEILVENETIVEYGQPLIRIK